MKVELICRFCKEKFRRYISSIRHSDNFCSYECFQKYKNSKITNQDYFDRIDTEHKAYWLGFLLADGNITSTTRKQKSLNLELSIMDIEHVKKFAEIFCSNVHTYHRINKKTGKSSSSAKCSITSSHLWNSVFEKGLSPNKSLLPNVSIFNSVPEKFMKDFIRGVYDGDGGIFQGKIPSRISIQILGSFEFLSLLLSKMETAGMNRTKIVKRKNANIFLLQWSGRIQCKKFCDYIYNDCSIYLDRKKEKAEKILR